MSYVYPRGAVTRDEEAAATWDGRVDSWEGVAASDAFQALRDRICDLAAPAPTDRVVDLGAGTGLLALALAPRVAQVTAVDVSEAMVVRLREKAEAAGLANVEAVVADLRTLPLPDASVDLVVSNYAFHHLDDAGKELALAEARRVLVPGGRMVVCDMMFSLSLEPRDRRLVLSKAFSIARKGPSGWYRLLRNAGRMAAGRWEHPAPPNAWEQFLLDRHFVDVAVEPLEHEGGIARASRPRAA
jgi:ubiquinone/menaquinone biosynthesis C-methylase UbiE